MLVLLIVCLILPITSFAHSETRIIEMTPDGFSPDLVTIDINSTIIFLNKDTRPRWPASNVHPTHELYPEFDPKKAIDPGKSWTFKPKNPGEWKFHDHIFPHMRGTIKVIAEPGTQQNSTVKPQVSVIDNIKNLTTGLIGKLKNLLCFTRTCSFKK
ncbi:MAG: Uncharacterized protein CEO21_253, partial [Microgenomates group bacterium Gr01-1014_80]